MPRHGLRLALKRIRAAQCAAQGFTLIEVMVAAMLLLFAVIGIVPFYLSGLNQSSSIRYKSIATNIARERMEEIRQLDYREIVSAEYLATHFGTSATQRGIDFQVSYKVEESPYDEGTLKKVTVNVGWTAPPKVSAAEITTMIHQQFLGPRGALLEVTPQLSDPLGTPFPLISSTTKAKYHIAQADWSLVFNNLDQPSMSKRDVYCRLALFDDQGESIALGDAAHDFMIDNTHLFYSKGADDKVSDVWFEYTFDASTIPDGYYEMRAVAYNQYDQPGNVWRLRIRVENGGPAAPLNFTAIPQPDNHSVILTWAGGPERDRLYYVLERQTYSGGWTGAWTQLISDMDPNQTTYTDVGSIASQQDPWGTYDTPHRYQYRIYAVDFSNPGNVGSPALAETEIPSATTTTTVATTTTTTIETPTTTSTTTATTSTTVASYSVQIKNTTNKSYSVSIKNGSGSVVFSGTVNRNSTKTISGLATGNYLITATTSGRPTITQSFSVPAQAGQIVLTIL
jgi:type II secretory pathway pseudopilin PulG